MKKWILLSSTLLVIFVLTACGGGEKEATATIEENGVSSELIYKAKGDKVYEQSAKNELYYEDFGITGKEDAEAQLGDIAAEFEGVEGMEHQLEFLDDKMIETLTIDFDKANIDELKQLTGAIFEGEEGQDISLKQTMEMLEEEGYDIKEE